MDSNRLAGLPLGAREGYIAVDRQPGRLYLGILINSRSSIYCWDCAWKNLRPAIYVSQDNGHTWAFRYQFKRGPAENSGFIGVFVDPTQEAHVYTVIKNGDQITFYASGTAGQFWKPICDEYFNVGRTCHLPEAIMQFQTNFPQNGGSHGE